MKSRIIAILSILHLTTAIACVTLFFFHYPDCLFPLALVSLALSLWFAALLPVVREIDARQQRRRAVGKQMLREAWK